MSNFENKYKNLVEGSLVNVDEKDMDSMWAAIEPEIKKGKKRGVAFWLFISFLLLSVLGLVVLSFVNSTDVTPVLDTRVDIANSTNPPMNTSHTQDNHKDLKTEKTSTPKENQEESTESITNTKSTYIEHSNGTKILDSKNQKSEKIITVQHGQSIHSKVVHDTSTQIFTKVKKTSPTIVNLNKSSQIIIDKNYYSLNGLPRINLKSIVSKDKEKTLAIAANFQIIPEDEEKSLPITIGFYVGRNYHNTSFTHTSDPALQDLKNASMDGFYGNTLGLNLRKPITYNTYISTGIEYQDLWSKLDYVNTRNFQVEKINQLLRVQIGATSMDTLAYIYGDTTVNAEGIRTVKHYNRTTLMSIPLSGGIQLQFSRLTLGLSAGASLDFRLIQKGRLLEDAISIIDYDEKINTPLNKMGFSLRANIDINYAISDNFQLFLEQSMRMSKESVIPVDGLSQRSLVSSLNLGVRYRL